MPSCVYCHGKKLKCDKGNPCSRCERLGLKCEVRERKRPKKRKAKGAPEATEATGTSAHQGAAGTPGTPPGAGAGGQQGASIFDEMMDDLASGSSGSDFFSPQVDLSIFDALKELSPSHWGLRVTVKYLMCIAQRKMNMGLIYVVSGFAARVGLTSYFPMVFSEIRREVKVGEYDDVPEYILRKHDEAVGVTSAAGGWDADRIILISNREYDTGSQFILSPEARRLLVTEEAFASFPTDFLAHDKLVQDRLETKDYNAVACANLQMLPAYKTKHSGPLSSCVQNVTLHTLQGPIQVHVYQTLWFGNTGYDGLGIEEFVPVDRVSASATARVMHTTPQDEARAAQTMMALSGDIAVVESGGVMHIR